MDLENILRGGNQAQKTTYYDSIYRKPETCSPGKEGVTCALRGARESRFCPAHSAPRHGSGVRVGFWQPPGGRWLQQARVKACPPGGRGAPGISSGRLGKGCGWGHGGSPVKNLPGRPVGEEGREGCEQKGHPPLHGYSQSQPQHSRVRRGHPGLRPQS